MPRYTIYAALTHKEQLSIARGNVAVCDDKLSTMVPGSSNVVMYDEQDIVPPAEVVDDLKPESQHVAENAPCGSRLTQHIDMPCVLLQAQTRINDSMKGTKPVKNNTTRGILLVSPKLIFMPDYLHPQTLECSPESEKAEQEMMKRLSNYTSLRHAIERSPRYARQDVDLTAPEVQATLSYVFSEKHVAIPEGMSPAFLEGRDLDLILQTIKADGHIHSITRLPQFCDECQEMFEKLKISNPDLPDKLLALKSLQTVASQWSEKLTKRYDPDNKLFAKIAQDEDRAIRDALTDYSTVTIITPAMEEIPEGR